MTRKHLYLLALLWTTPLRTHAAELADPTRPLAAKVAPVAKIIESGPLKLEGIVHSATRDIAIINGRLVKPGEWIGDARIEIVARDSVRYTRAGRSQVLALKTPIKVKRSPAVREVKR